MYNRPIMIYGGELTFGEARELYFLRNGFGTDGGYSERWIKVKVWRLPIWLPNVKNRREAVKLHDLHHVLTEYPTTWRGEAEISAWEVGSGGLGRFWAGWILDLMNIAQGLLIHPRGVYRAFIRGRQTENLYRLEFDDELLSHRVGEFRERLKLEKPLSEANIVDKIWFCFWVIVSIATYAAAIAAMPLFLLLGWWVLFA